MRKAKTLLFILLICFPFSCEQKVKEDTTKENVSSEAVIDSIFISNPNYKLMLDIDNLSEESTKVYSLRWERQSTEKGSQFLEESVALYSNGAPMKIEESFVDGDFYAASGNRFYYLDESGKLIGAIEEREDWLDTMTPVLVQNRTLFLENDSIFSQQRMSDSYLTIDTVKWENTSIETPPLNMALSLLYGDAPFKTHFISVFRGEQLFLILGENKQDNEGRWSTAVRVDEMTPIIEDLLNNIERYKFRPVSIQFDKVGGGNQPIFRVLKTIEWVD